MQRCKCLILSCLILFVFPSFIIASSTSSEDASSTTPSTSIDSEQFPRASSPYQCNDPLSINYMLDKAEDYLEKKLDKEYKVNWDFEIVYHDSKAFVSIEYLSKDLKIFNKLTPEQLENFLKKVMKEITKNYKKEIEIHGILIEDDAKTASYTFMYKDGKLDIR